MRARSQSQGDSRVTLSSRSATAVLVRGRPTAPIVSQRMLPTPKPRCASWEPSQGVARQRGTVRHAVAQRPRDGRHPLPNRDHGKDTIDEVDRLDRHPTTSARRATSLRSDATRGPTAARADVGVCRLLDSEAPARDLMRSSRRPTVPARGIASRSRHPESHRDHLAPRAPAEVRRSGRDTDSGARATSGYAASSPPPRG